MTNLEYMAKYHAMAFKCRTIIRALEQEADSYDDEVRRYQAKHNDEQLGVKDDLPCHHDMGYYKRDSVIHSHTTDLTRGDDQ